MGLAANAMHRAGSSQKKRKCHGPGRADRERARYRTDQNMGRPTEIAGRPIKSYVSWMGLAANVMDRPGRTFRKLPGRADKIDKYDQGRAAAHQMKNVWAGLGQGPPVQILMGRATVHQLKN